LTPIANDLSTSDLATRFSMSAPAISRHLSVLEKAELVTSERRGQFVYYKLNRDNLVNTLTGFAFELCPVAGPLKREARRRAGERCACACTTASAPDSTGMRSPSRRC
jgi:DNA-binding transcriptional ArsR family regulator